MDMWIVGVAVFLSFLIGLLLDVDSFAGGIFSIFKSSKDKSN